LFFQELVSGTGLLRTEVENALRELIAAGYVSGDGFAGLRALAISSDKTLGTSAMKRKNGRPGILPVIPLTAGRWFAFRLSRTLPNDKGSDLAELCARQLLARYGVVFRRLLERESGLPPWRDLLYCFRRLEARGEIRGGRFVAGFTGEQYALPEAVQQLRTIRRKTPDGRFLAVSGADPLNLVGILTPGPRVNSLSSNRILYRDGLPIAARDAGNIIELHPSAADHLQAVKSILNKSLALYCSSGADD
jgi:ATP-dependent Lhr-like helicase